VSEVTAGAILLAEDDPVGQVVTRAILEQLGFRVDVVCDGPAAVDAAAATPYGAILLDCQLPVLDGYLAATEMRRWQGASRGARIIAITASGTELDRARCRGAGMDDYLVKPLTTLVLSECLAHWARDEPALDAAIVERLERLGTATGEDLMGQLTVLFLSDADAHVAGMRDALANHDVASLLRSAHTLTGASGNLGATHLAELFSMFAVEGVASSAAEGGALLNSIEAELGRVRTALDARMLTS
jgi:CheY-like chemotaxis protein